jgi:hypothetical protein
LIIILFIENFKLFDESRKQTTAGKRKRQLNFEGSFFFARQSKALIMKASIMGDFKAVEWFLIGFL